MALYLSTADIQKFWGLPTWQQSSSSFNAFWTSAFSNLKGREMVKSQAADWYVKAGVYINYLNTLADMWAY